MILCSCHEYYSKMIGAGKNWRLTWKTPRKKGRKWSNISVKKYHHMPTLGVRSDTVNLYVR